MPSRVDLHTHTTASDGTLEPEKLFHLAAELQIKVLAVSDHDTTAGFDTIVARRDQHPDVRLIPAIEMNAEGPYACHLLGYFVDPSNEEFQSKLRVYRERRVERVQQMVERLNALGMAITFRRVQELSAGGAVGRPHLADALREKGYVKTRQEAFDRFLKKGGVAYVGADSPSAQEAIAVIRRAGGVPVLAHPSFYLSEPLLENLTAAGLLGMEVYYPEHGRSLIRRYLEIAQRYGLVATGGSDFHGPKTGRASLASVDVPESVVGELEKARERV